MNQEDIRRFNAMREHDNGPALSHNFKVDDRVLVDGNGLYAFAVLKDIPKNGLREKCGHILVRIIGTERTFWVEAKNCTKVEND